MLFTLIFRPPQSDWSYILIHWPILVVLVIHYHLVLMIIYSYLYFYLWLTLLLGSTRSFSLHIWYGLYCYSVPLKIVYQIFLHLDWFWLDFISMITWVLWIYLPIFRSFLFGFFLLTYFSWQKFQLTFVKHDCDCLIHFQSQLYLNFVTGAVIYFFNHDNIFYCHLYLSFLRLMCLTFESVWGW